MRQGHDNSQCKAEWEGPRCHCRVLLIPGFIRCLRWRNLV